MAKTMFSGKTLSRRPLGPVTPMRGPSTVISTPEGMVMGFLPMRLTSPNLAQNFAAELAAAGFAIGQEPLRRGNDGDAEPALDPGQFVGGPVDAVPGTGDPLETRDGRRAPGPVTKEDREVGLDRLRGDLESVDVALRCENPGGSLPEVGGRHRHHYVAYRHGIADPRQHVGDGICEHYQEAFLSPGSSPRWAGWRTQMRHIPKSRR